MYFPILRGRQFELLALRECVKENVLSNQIIPIVEPVKVSSTYIKTIDSFIEAKKPIAVIRNPQVGSWSKELEKESNINIRNHVQTQFETPCVISSFYVTPKLEMNVRTAVQMGNPIESLLLICNNPEYVDEYENVIGEKIPLYLSLIHISEPTRP